MWQKEMFVPLPENSHLSNLKTVTADFIIVAKKLSG
jgi:hypothetical protein